MATVKNPRTCNGSSADMSMGAVITSPLMRDSTSVKIINGAKYQSGDMGGHNDESRSPMMNQ